VKGLLVRGGYALLTIYEPDDQYADVLYFLEDQAQEGKVGGWADVVSSSSG